ncbi:MAG: hypothetical protein Kow0090_14310 [Myxococcota bacterium]
MLAAILLCAIPISIAVACAHSSEQNRKQAEIAYDLGANNFQNRRFRDAIYNFEQAINHDETFAPAHNGLGLLYHALKRYDEAIKYYERALELDPKYSEAKNNLASVYIDMGEYDKALPFLKEVLSDLFYKTPFLAEGNLGWALYKKGNTMEGINHIKKAVILNPAFCMGYKNLGIIFEEQNELEQAEKYFKKYAQKCPTVADAHYLLGRIYLKSGKPEDAKISFAECKLHASEVSDLAEECEKLSATIKK